MKVGVISDTHGLLRPEALRALAGSDHIVHAGDIGGADILEALRSIAPVTAVRGNNDRGEWAAAIAGSGRVRLGQAWIHVVHDLAALDFDPAADGVAVVIAGHSHRPLLEERDGVLFLNPGSAGPRRFSLPVSVAHLAIDGARVQARLQRLDIPSPRERR